MTLLSTFQRSDSNLECLSELLGKRKESILPPTRVNVDCIGVIMSYWDTWVWLKRPLAWAFFSNWAFQIKLVGCWFLVGWSIGSIIIFWWVNLGSEWWRIETTSGSYSGWGSTLGSWMDHTGCYYYIILYCIVLYYFILFECSVLQSCFSLCFGNVWDILCSYRHPPLVTTITTTFNSESNVGITQF